MKMQRTPSSGLTLIEVITAMALLGTLLVAVLVAYSRNAVRIERASERLRIMRESESQLAAWHLQFGMVPVNEEGDLLVGRNTYRWRTRPKQRVLDPKFMIGTVEYEVLSLEDRQSLLKLELVVPSWDE